MPGAVARAYARDRPEVASGRSWWCWSDGGARDGRLGLRAQAVEVGGAREDRLHDRVLGPGQREQEPGAGHAGNVASGGAVVVEPVAQDRSAYVAQQAAELA